MFRPDEFFDLSHVAPIVAEVFDGVSEVWLALPRLQPVLERFFRSSGRVLGQIEPGAVLVHPESIFVGKGTHIESGAYIRGPAYLGEDCHVRHGAYLRGGVIAGNGCVLGHASEFKNAVLLDEASAAHFAYVGDSLLGRRVTLGAGARLSNFGLLTARRAALEREPTVKLRVPQFSSSEIDTGLVKLGAIVGDDVQMGCNVVTNPGCLVGPRTIVYPQVSLSKGYWAGGRIIKLRQTLEQTPLT